MLRKFKISIDGTQYLVEMEEVGAPTSSISTRYCVPSIEILNLRSMAALLFHLVDVLDGE